MRKNGKYGAITAFFVFVVMYAFFYPATANAVMCTATTGGVWANGSIWDCGHAPLNTDNVVITDGAAVEAGGTLDSFYSLTIDGNADLVLVPQVICHTPDPVDIGGADGLTVSFTDCSMGSGDSVTVNWGDGSMYAGGSLDVPFSHHYLWKGNYSIQHSISSSPYSYGLSEVIPVKVPQANDGTLAVTTTPAISGINVYAYQGSNSWHLVTGASGTASFTLPANQYTVYLYYTAGHSCDFTNGTAFTVTTGGTTTASATSCN